MAGTETGKVVTSGALQVGSGGCATGAGSNKAYQQTQTPVGTPPSECPSGGGCDCECKSCSGG